MDALLAREIALLAGVFSEVEVVSWPAFKEALILKQIATSYTRIAIEVISLSAGQASRVTRAACVLNWIVFIYELSWLAG